jgi:hypothetical protein
MLLKKVTALCRYATIESDRMIFWIDVAHSMLALNQCCAENLLKSFFNSIGQKRTSGLIGFEASCVPLAFSKH